MYPNPIHLRLCRLHNRQLVSRFLRFFLSVSIAFSRLLNTIRANFSTVTSASSSRHTAYGNTSRERRSYHWQKFHLWRHSSAPRRTKRLRRKSRSGGRLLASSGTECVNTATSLHIRTLSGHESCNQHTKYTLLALSTPNLEAQHGATRGGNPITGRYLRSNFQTRPCLWASARGHSTTQHYRRYRVRASAGVLLGLISTLVCGQAVIWDEGMAFPVEIIYLPIIPWWIEDLRSQTFLDHEAVPALHVSDFHRSLDLDAFRDPVAAVTS